MKILFIGSSFGNAYLQYKALKDIYKKVDIIDGYNSILRIKTFFRIFIHISPFFFEKYLNNFFLKKVKKNYDLIYVRSGELIGRELIIELKKKTKKIVFFCNDNPFVKRDKNKWELFKKASKYYDLIIFQDNSRIIAAKKIGLKNIFLMYPPYDKHIHTTKKNYSYKKIYDVVFVGTWSPNKSLLIQRLINSNLNIKVFGPRWDKDPNFKKYKSIIKAKDFTYKRYTNIIKKAKIALCLFSNENKDTITARSIEIPAIGTFMMSYKTLAMKKIFKENKEVVFFKNYLECVNKCNYYLSNINKLNQIARNANIKVTQIIKNNNHEFVKKIITNVFNNK